MSQIKRWILYGLGLLVAALALGFGGTIGELVGRKAVSDFADGRENGAMEEAIRLAAVQMNQALPRRLDAATVLEEVATDGAVMTYRHSIDVSALAEMTGADFAARLKNRVTPQTCAAEDMRWAMDRGASYRWAYWDQSGSFYSSITVTAADCK